LIQLAEEDGIKVEVRRVAVKEIVEAAKDGSLKEIFGTGTAAVINPIQGFGHKGERYEIKNLTDSYATYFKERMMKIQYNLAEDKFGWRYLVKE